MRLRERRGIFEDTMNHKKEGPPLFNSDAAGGTEDDNVFDDETGGTEGEHDVDTSDADDTNALEDDGDVREHGSCDRNDGHRGRGGFAQRPWDLAP